MTVMQPPSGQPKAYPTIQRLRFMGGGNMARAIIGGLRKTMAGKLITVAEPVAAVRDALQQDFGVWVVDPTASDPAALNPATTKDEAPDVVVWAVKPQSFAQAAAGPLRTGPTTLHVSVMAGIRSEAIAHAVGSELVVRAMPNTPALIGQGIAGLYARPTVDATGKAWVEQVMRPTGQWVWLDDEAQLDAVTALSGSGPAYVFYVIEAMVAAGVRVGLSPEAAKQLAVATVQGAAALVAQSSESPSTLRERVTSKGGTTQAALDVLRAREVQAAIEAAVVAARDRAKQLGDEFGA
jgi:pyrroline-5-carboxylate reductase